MEKAQTLFLKRIIEKWFGNFLQSSVNPSEAEKIKIKKIILKYKWEAQPIRSWKRLWANSILTWEFPQLGVVTGKLRHKLGQTSIRWWVLWCFWCMNYTKKIPSFGFFWSLGFYNCWMFHEWKIYFHLLMLWISIYTSAMCLTNIEEISS